MTIVSSSRGSVVERLGNVYHHVYTSWVINVLKDIKCRIFIQCIDLYIQKMPFFRYRKGELSHNCSAFLAHFSSNYETVCREFWENRVVFLRWSISFWNRESYKLCRGSQCAHIWKKSILFYACWSSYVYWTILAIMTELYYCFSSKIDVRCYTVL